MCDPAFLSGPILTPPRTVRVVSYKSPPLPKRFLFSSLAPLCATRRFAVPMGGEISPWIKQLCPGPIGFAHGLHAETPPALKAANILWAK